MLTFAIKKKRTPSIAPKRHAPTVSPMSHSLHLQQAKVRHILRGPSLQPKLTIGQPNDKYEQEADRVADEVMRMPESRIQRQAEEEEEELIQTKPSAEQITPLVQRQMEEEEEPIQAKPAGDIRLQRQEPESEEEEKTLQAKPLTEQIAPLFYVQRQEEPEEEKEELLAKPLSDQITPLVQRQVEPEEEEEEEAIQTKLADGMQVQRQEEPEEEEEEPIQTKQVSTRAPAVIPNLASRIQSLRGGGQPLPKSVRDFFEPRFGHDFSQVRVHTESSAADTAKSINARAFTMGNHVVMGSGEYHPNSRSGQRLLGHELTHVVQQTGGLHRKMTLGQPVDRYEQEADEVAREVIRREHHASLYKYPLQKQNVDIKEDGKDQELQTKKTGRMSDGAYGCGKSSDIEEERELRRKKNNIWHQRKKGGVVRHKVNEQIQADMAGGLFAFAWGVAIVAKELKALRVRVKTAANELSMWSILAFRAVKLDSAQALQAVEALFLPLCAKATALWGEIGVFKKYYASFLKVKADVLAKAAGEGKLLASIATATHWHVRVVRAYRDAVWKAQFKTLFPEILSAFSDQDITGKIPAATRLRLIRFMKRPPAVPRTPYGPKAWGALKLWLAKPCPIAGTRLDPAQKSLIAGAMLVKAGMRAQDCGDWVSLVRGYARIGGYRYRPKTQVQRKGSGQHIEYFWKRAYKGRRVNSTEFKNIKAGDWLQFKWRGGGTHSVIFIKWITGNKNNKVRKAQTMSAGVVRGKNLPGWYGHHIRGRDYYTLTYLPNRNGEVYSILRPELSRRGKAVATSP